MEWWGDHAWAVWLAAAALLGIADLLSLDLFLVMLAVGALGGAATAAVGAPFVLQLIVAAIISVGMLWLVRPGLVSRLHHGPELKLGATKLIGARGVVTRRITGVAVGQIRLDGETWTAAPYDDDLVIDPGATAEVLEIRGATAYVHPIPELEA
jgi:membrane protein implicated in regulation of membrane protease activity